MPPLPLCCPSSLPQLLLTSDLVHQIAKRLLRLHTKMELVPHSPCRYLTPEKGPSGPRQDRYLVQMATEFTITSNRRFLCLDSGAPTAPDVHVDCFIQTCRAFGGCIFRRMGKLRTLQVVKFESIAVTMSSPKMGVCSSDVQLVCTGDGNHAAVICWDELPKRWVKCYHR